MLLLDGLERLASIFQAESAGWRSVCPGGDAFAARLGAVTRGKATARLALCKVTTWPGTRATVWCSERQEGSARGSGHQTPGMGNTATARAATARVLAGLGHLSSRRIEEAENKVLISLRL